MEEEIQFLSGLNYAEELEVSKRKNIQEMYNAGIDQDMIANMYPYYTADKVPTFSANVKDNQLVPSLILAGEAISNPSLLESSEEHKTAYNNYIGYRQNESFRKGFIFKTSLDLYKKLTGSAFTQSKEAGDLYDNLDADSKKALDWLDYKMSVYDQNKQNNLKTLDTLGSVSGILADTIGLQVKLGGSANTVKQAVASSNIGAADSIIGRAVADQFIKHSEKFARPITEGFLKKAAITATIAEDTAMGTAFVLRDIMTNDDLKSMEFKDQVTQLSKEFGVGVAMDFGANMLFNILVPGAKNYGRIFFTPNAGKVVKKGTTTTDEAIELASQALRGEVSKDTLSKLKRTGNTDLAERLETFNTQVKDVKTLKDLGQDELATIKLLAGAYDMDVKAVEGGFEVIKDTMSKRKNIKRVTTLGEVAELIDNKHLQGLKRNAEKTHKLASVTKDLKVTQQFEGSIKSPKAKLDIVDFSESVMPRTGAFNQVTKGDTLQYTKNAIRNLGEGVTESLDNLKVRIDDSFFKKLPSATADELVLPRQIINADQHKRYVKYIGDFIEAHGNNIDKEVLDQTLDSLRDLTGKWSVRDMDWVSSQAKKLDMEIIRRDGQLILKDGGDLIPFDDEGLLGNYVFSKTITDDEFVEYLKIEKNYTYAKDPETGYAAIYDQFEDKVAIGEDIRDIMENNPMLRPKYPLRTGPKLSFITDSGRDIRFNGQYVEGSSEQIMKYLDNYSDTKFASDIKDFKKMKKVTRTDGKQVMVDIKKRRWLVESEGTGMKPKIFKSEKKLREFLSSINTPEKTLLDVARQKGVQVTANRAGYIIQKAGQADQVAKNLDEAMAKIRKLPNQAAAPEALERAAIETEQAQDIYSRYATNIDNRNFSEDQNIATVKHMMDLRDESFHSRSRSELEKKTSRLFSKFRDGRAKIASIPKGNPELRPLMEKFDNLMETEKVMKTIQSKFHEAMVGLNKTVKRERRELLGNLLSKELPETEWDTAFTRMTGETLTSDDKDFLRGVRKLFDDAAEVNGMTRDLEHIENYFPRMKTLSMEDLLNPKENAISLMKKTLGRELSPAESKFYKNMRAVDLIEYKAQTDPLAMLQKYTDDTLRANLIEPAVQDMVDFAANNITDAVDKESVMEVARAARGINDDQWTKRFKEFYDTLAVNHHKAVSEWHGKAFKDKLTPVSPKEFMTNYIETVDDTVLKKMNEVSREKFEAKISNRKFNKNPINNLMGAITLSTQAFKPWLPIRNTFQPETHLAPIFGLDAVVRAKKDVSSLSAEGYQYLARNSIFQSKTPQEITGLTGGGVIQSANEIGLQWYKASDDFDRAVGFMVVKNSLEDAVSALDAWGDNATKYFLESTRLYTAPQHIRDTVLDSIQRGDMEVATLTYANWMNSMSFLDYSAIARPEAYNSFFGKMFGQMGTFATQTFSSRKYFLERMTKKDMGLYVARAVLGGLALNSVFSELTGTEVNNFSSWKSMVFGGGPLVQTGYNITQLLGTDIARERAKANLRYQATGAFIPWNTASNIVGGTRSILEGDLHSGILQAINAPGKGQFKQDNLTPLERVLGRL